MPMDLTESFLPRTPAIYFGWEEVPINDIIMFTNIQCAGLGRYIDMQTCVKNTVLSKYPLILSRHTTAIPRGLIKYNSA